MSKPLANYAAYRRMGDYVFMSGVIGTDPATRVAATRYDQLPEAARAELKTLGYVTGQTSVDVYEAPAAVQSWLALNAIREMAAECGGGMKDVARLVQYFTDVRHYPIYNRVRGLFFSEPVVSTVVEVSRMMPSDEVLIEVEATLYLPAGRP
jgi:enamine deaminase RidA (YjgF/YER057c/UK114 family)